MVQRFNPPPGWPSAPSGWLPPSGWQPPTQAPPGLPPIRPHWPWVVQSHHSRRVLVIAAGSLAAIALVVGIASVLPGGGFLSSTTCYLESNDGPVAAKVVGPDSCASDATLLANHSASYWSPTSAEGLQAWRDNEESYNPVQDCSFHNGGTTLTIYYSNSALGSAFGSTVCEALQRQGRTTQ
jgi:hypothetical protein